MTGGLPGGPEGGTLQAVSEVSQRNQSKTGSRGANESSKSTTFDSRALPEAPAKQFQATLYKVATSQSYANWYAVFVSGLRQRTCWPAGYRFPEPLSARAQLVNRAH